MSFVTKPRNTQESLSDIFGSLLTASGPYRVKSALSVEMKEHRKKKRNKRLWTAQTRDNLDELVDK
jgi:hypothetical protein